MKRINWRVVAAAFILAVSIIVVAFVLWAGAAYMPDDAALQAMNSDAQVFVSPENGWVVFLPAENSRPETGLIFYPGAKVDYRAYAPVMRLIAAQGHFVAVVPVPLNMALFDVNAAARVQAAYPEIRNWFVGGHSLGGVAAAAYAGSHAEIRGVVLLASTPGDDSLIKREVAVLSIYGTNDGVFPSAMLEDSKKLLPMQTQFVPIDGGNHSQFGSYGLQAGDNVAGISPGEQWAQVADAAAKFFEDTLK